MQNKNKKINVSERKRVVIFLSRSFQLTYDFRKFEIFLFSLALLRWAMSLYRLVLNGRPQIIISQ